MKRAMRSGLTSVSTIHHLEGSVFAVVPEIITRPFTARDYSTFGYRETRFMGRSSFHLPDSSPLLASFPKRSLITQVHEDNLKLSSTSNPNNSAAILNGVELKNGKVDAVSYLVRAMGRIIHMGMYCHG